MNSILTIDNVVTLFKRYGQNSCMFTHPRCSIDSCTQYASHIIVMDDGLGSEEIFLCDSHERELTKQVYGGKREKDY